MSNHFCCCRATLDEAGSAGYEITDAEYASNEVEDTWVNHLLGVLVAVLQWLQPLLTPSNYDALVASLLQKARPLSVCHVSLAQAHLPILHHPLAKCHPVDSCLAMSSVCWR